MHLTLPKYWTFLLFILLWGACSAPHKETSDRPLIVTTTGIIADCVKEIVGEQAEVLSIMGPGVDPHLYKASQGDLEKLSRADIIVYNGLHLEGKMAQMLERLGRSKPVFAVGAHVSGDKLRPVSDGGSLYDPHIWFDPYLWLEGLEGVSREIGATEWFTAVGVDSSYNAFANKVRTAAERQHATLDEQLAGISRVLITSHDAFSYFGEAFHFEVRGLQGISTAAEYGVKDVQDMVTYIISNKVNAVFVETSVSDKNLRSVVEAAAAQGHQLKIGGRLYSDALGEAGSSGGTYIGMLESNIQTIINGLRS